MATKIRLKRIGRRNRPFYRLIVIDSRKKRDGAAIEQIGWFNPIATENSYEINDERILHWLGEGAEPTDAAKKLLRRAGLSHQWHLMQQGLEGSDLEKEMKKWELNREDVLKNRAEKDKKKVKEVSKENEESVLSEQVSEEVSNVTEGNSDKDSDQNEAQEDKSSQEEE